MTHEHANTLTSQSLTELDVQECPWHYYRAMHEEANGFYYDERIQMFVCANYQTMREILRNPGLFSSVNSQNIGHMRTPPQAVRDIEARSVRPVNILVSADPPEHGRVRKLLDDPFRPRAIEKLRPRIRDIVNHAIDEFIDRGQFEAVAQFAIPIPVTVIAGMLGLDRKHAGDVKAWSDAAVEPLGMMISDERWIECAATIADFQAFMTDQLERRRNAPGEDLLTHLVEARDEHGNPLTLGEMLGVTAQLLVAGNETTTNGIAAGIQLLIDNPEQQASLKNDTSRMYTFVNEALRLESPVQGLFRIAKEDTMLQGTPVPQGSRIMIRFAAANRDGQKYRNPDSLDIHRSNAGTQVGFGAGIHHCLGANLAREEMYQAFTILLERLSNLHYVDDANDFTHHPSMVLRGLKSLHVAFDA